MPPAKQHAYSVCTHSDRLFLPLPRGQVIDLLDSTGEVPKCQTQLADPAPFGDLNLQSMEPPKKILHQKKISSPDYDWILESEDITTGPVKSSGIVDAYVPVGIKETKKKIQFSQRLTLFL